jgi:ABC-2 type transport system permease protein
VTLNILLQSIILTGVAWLVGADFDGGIAGILVLFGMSILLGVSFGALSDALGLFVRREESVIAASQFIVLPLTFLSSIFMQQDLVPDWIRTVSRFNPVNWTVRGGRSALSADTDWSLVLQNTGLLIAFLFVCGWLAHRAFNSYQRSI